MTPGQEAEACHSNEKIAASGHTSQGSCSEAAIIGSEEKEIGVTAMVTPILSLGFWGTQSDARYDCGHRSIQGFPLRGSCQSQD